jgi:hypothetical protein
VSDFTAQVQKPGLLGVAPTYNACTAADKFTAATGGRYMLHYKNGATPQATGGLPNKITNPTAVVPPGASPAAGWQDAVTQVSPGMTATTEFVAWIDNATTFKDGTGFVNLVHPGTITTMTVAIFGPF